MDTSSLQLLQWYTGNDSIQRSPRITQIALFHFQLFASLFCVCICCCLVPSWMIKRELVPTESGFFKVLWLVTKLPVITACSRNLIKIWRNYPINTKFVLFFFSFLFIHFFMGGGDAWLRRLCVSSYL